MSRKMLQVRARSVKTLLDRALSTASRAPLLVTPSQVAGLPPQSTVFLDATWVMPTSPRKPTEEFLAHRIPGAKFLDIDDVASHTELGRKLGLKHMMPEPKVFAQACDKFGITPQSHVILYDTQGCFSSPRALFMFRAFFHDKSSVLNGGLARWLGEGLPIESGPQREAIAAQDAYPLPQLDEGVIRSYEQIVSNSNVAASDPGAEIVLDARSRGRYHGTEPEPRPGLPSGHIPGTLSLPFTSFLANHGPPSADKSPVHSLPSHLAGGYATLRPPEELLEELRKVVGVDAADQILAERRRVVATCGSGLTAAILWLGLSSIWEAQRRALPQIPLYDESWTGYAARPESKIATGEEGS